MPGVADKDLNSCLQRVLLAHGWHNSPYQGILTTDVDIRILFIRGCQSTSRTFKKASEHIKG